MLFNRPVLLCIAMLHCFQQSFIVAILSNHIAPVQVFINSEPELSLSVTLHINCIVAPCLINKALPGKLDIKRHSPSILYVYTSL